MFVFLSFLLKLSQYLLEKSRVETEPNLTAFERNPKIGLAQISHTIMTYIVASCLEGSSHNKQHHLESSAQKLSYIIMYDILTITVS